MHALASQSIYIKGNTFQMKAEISDKVSSASPWPLVNLTVLTVTVHSSLVPTFHFF